MVEMFEVWFFCRNHLYDDTYPYYVVALATFFMMTGTLWMTILTY